VTLLARGAAGGQLGLVLGLGGSGGTADHGGNGES
jgi:hypothetical protein